MLLKSCPRCGKLIPYGKRYCIPCEQEHAAEREAYLKERKSKWNAAYNAKRDPKYTRFYASTDWKRLSKAKMAKVGYRCEVCGAIATEVHHIQPIQTNEGWEKRLEWSNLQAVCLDCHNQAHGRFTPRAKRSSRSKTNISNRTHP